MTDKRLTPAQVAARLGNSERTLQRWRKEKTGPVWGRSGARFYYLESDVAAWEKQKQAAMSDYYSISEAAKLLELSENTLAVWRMKAIGPDFLKIGRIIGYPKPHFHTWAKNNGYKI